LKLLLLLACAMALNLSDFATYVRACWTVQGKDGKRHPFVLNGPQRCIEYEIAVMRAAGRAALIKELKSRQMGMSLHANARLLHAVQTQRGARALSMADKQSVPREWRDRADGWNRETKQGIRPEPERSNVMELYFGGLDSRYTFGSSEGKTPGMSLTTPLLHLSEAENYRNPRKVYADIMPSVPLQNPGCLVIQESTGELEGSYWYDQVQLTLSGGDAYKLVFLPWWCAADYRLPGKGLRTEEYTDQEREMVARAAEWVQAAPVYAALCEFDGLSPEHLAWYRWTLANVMHGDEVLMRSRYPSAIPDAFMGVGSKAIPPMVLAAHKSQVREPLAVGRLEYNGSAVVWVDDPQGCWTLLEQPEQYCEYAIGGDPCKGALSDPDDPRSERDWAVIGVLNRQTLTTCATFRGRVEADDFGREMRKAGLWWNEAWLSPEVNVGQACLMILRDYPRLMTREGLPEDLKSRDLSKLGWETTPQNRDLLIDEWIDACRPGPTGEFEGRVKCLCWQLYAEERTFIRHATGKRAAMRAKHDDILFAYMIALQVHKRCPHMRLAVLGDRLRREARVVEGREIPAAAYAGGVDAGIPGLNGEDEEDDFL